jgi:UDP-N-acetylglucosamine 2-epimerase
VRVVTIIGNRPQFVKAAAVSRLLRAEHEEVLVHSGQHYDDELSAVFFRELDLPAPDRELGVGSGANAQQVAAMMHALEPVLNEVGPAVALVYGDTNTTLAGTLSSAKLGVPVVHIESGMRSFDGSMPEERNRLITDHLSELRLCSTTTAVDNLAAEGIKDGVRLVGDVMADVTLMALPLAEAQSNALERFELEEDSYLLVTAHRAGNVDADEPLARLMEVLEALPLPALFPVHPRTLVRLRESGGLKRLEAVEGLVLTPPLGYLDFLKLLNNSAAVLTDSGGVQKEAYLVGVPCLTLRDRTEWVETVELGWNRLVGLDRERVLDSIGDLDPPAGHPELYGGGRAGAKVVEAIDEWASSRGLQLSEATE